MKFPISTLGLLSIMFVTIEGDPGDLECECPLTRKRYYLYTDKKVDWMTANQICAENDQRLASIMDASENECLSNLIGKSYSRKDHFWTSGNDLDDGSTFTWRSNGERFRYTNWRGGSPTHALSPDGQVEHCVDIVYSLKDPRAPQGTVVWTNAFCTNLHLFVCEK